MNKMYSNIRLKDHKALVVGDLTSLGKVNVICGANNSGKTTLLEAFVRERNIFLGRLFDAQTEVQALKNALQSHNKHLNVSGTTVTLLTFFTKATDIDEALTQTMSQFPVVFGDDTKRFTEAFEDNSQKIAQGMSSRPHFDLKRYYEKEGFRQTVQRELSTVFQRYLEESSLEAIKTDEVVLVTPKRKIDSTADIATSPDVGDDGQRLIQRLFLLKSQLPDSSGRKFFDQYWQAFQDVTGNLKFDIEIHEASQKLRLLFSAIDKEQWRFADDCGLGLRELMTILYFSTEKSKKLVLIEEPENHLHPELQRRLLWYLKERTPASKQFVLSTHSSVFLDDAFVDRIFQTRLIGDRIVIDDATSKARVLNDLGYSVADNLVSDLVIAVEGSGDKAVLTDFLARMNLLGKHNIKFWILNGDAMRNLDLEGFADRFSIEVLLDNDPKSDEIRKPFLAECKRLGIPVTKLQRYSIESYFPVKVYRESFGESIPKKLTSFKENEPVWAQLGSKIKKADIKKGSKKFASRTNLDDIKDTDLGGFLSKVEEILSSKKKPGTRADAAVN